MALIVEDGTGKSDAESYLSEADADTYHTAHGNPTAWSGATSAAKEEALRMGTQYLDVVYGQRWLGSRSNTDQALAWPRSDVVDYDGLLIASNTIPQDLKDATAEAAIRHISETNGLLPDVSEPGDIASETDKVGPISTSRTYVGGRSQLKQFSLIDGLIAGLVAGAGRIIRS